MRRTKILPGGEGLRFELRAWSKAKSPLGNMTPAAGRIEAVTAGVKLTVLALTATGCGARAIFSQQGCCAAPMSQTPAMRLQQAISSMFML